MFSLLHVIVAVSKWSPVFLCHQYTMQDLLERIQASEEEIKAHLDIIHACQIDGKWWFKKKKKLIDNKSVSM